MTVRKTFKSLVLLLILLGLAASAYGWWWWSRTDELLRQELLKKRAEFAPEWDVEIGRAHFDWNRRIHVHDITIRAKGQAATVITLPEVILTVDRRKLSETQDVVIQRVQILNPVADFVRNHDGRWNWRALLTLKSTDKALPEWEIEQGTINLLLERTDGMPPTGIVIRNLDLQLIPSAKRQFVVRGATLVDRVGKLSLDGEWNIDGKTWRVDGRMQDVTSGSELLAMAAISSPEFQTKLVRAEDLLRRASGESPTTALNRTASRDGRTYGGASLPGPAADRPEPPSGVPDFGVHGSFDLDFRLEDTPQTEPQFKFLISAKQGQVANGTLPFPLRDVQGKIYWDNQHVRIRNLTASNGTTKLWVDGEFHREGGAVPGQIAMSCTNLQLDERLRGRLPDSIRRIYDTVRPQGQADVMLTLQHDASGEWSARDFRLIAKDCSLAHERFNYRATNLSGSVEQRGPSLYGVNLEGTLGRRPVAVQGTVRDPGPAAEVAFTIGIDQLPLDEQFIEACPRPAQKVLQSLGLQGIATGTVALYRPAGLYQDFATSIKVRIQDGSLEYADFPYRVTGLQGQVAFDSLAGLWTFSDVQGMHGTSRLTAAGSYAIEPQPLLKVQLIGEAVQLDKHLELALPVALQGAWGQISPSGKADATVNIAWTPHQPLQVDVPQARIYDASLTFHCFPYPLENVSAELFYRNDYLQIQRFSAWHDQTHLQGPRNPNPQGAGFLICPAEGEWRIRIQDAMADDLQIGREFREALPLDLRSVISSLDPRGSLSLAGTLEFRGTSNPRDRVTAAWDLEAVLTEARLTLAEGLPLENLYGNLTSRGTWDGQQGLLSGAIDLRSLKVLGYQLAEVRGPWQIKDRQLTVGSSNALVPHQQGKSDPIPLEQRMTARAFGRECLLTFDAAVLLEDEPSYHLLLTMSQGRLEEYARLYLPDSKNLAGIMNGWIDLYGRGSSTKLMKGHGKLQISPAALYELPVILQMFQVLSLGAPDRAAFKYAFVDFAVNGGAFHFNLIDLVGDAIGFRGKGTASYDGTLALDFYSRMPRSRIPLPLVKQIIDPLLNEVTTGWVGVTVTGRASAPHAELTPAPVLDEAMRRFLSAFEPPSEGVPRFNVPTLTPRLPASPTERSR